MVVALLERGGPMSLDAIAERLLDAGADSRAGDMLLSLKKSWRRRDPVYENEDGLLALDLTHPDVGRRLFDLGLIPPYVERLPEPPPIVMPGCDVALSHDEVDAALRGRRLYGLSPTRVAAAVLDAHGKPMTSPAIDQYLRADKTLSRPPEGAVSKLRISARNRMPVAKPYELA